MGTQPPWLFLQKEASSTIASISFVFFFPAKIVLHCIFGSYGDFRAEKTPSICIFPSLIFFRSKKSSLTVIYPVWSFRFRKIGLHGDSANVVVFPKRSVFHDSFNIIRFVYRCL